MFKIKTVVIGFVVVFAVCAATVSSASAAWYVEGEELAAKATLALATTAQVDESTTLSDPTLGLKLTCTGGPSKVLSAVKPFIQGIDSAGAESFIFQGCSEITPSTCKIETSIETEPLVASVEESISPADRLRFSPRVGKTLAAIDFTGTCSIAGEKPVNGQLSLNAPALQADLVEQPVQVVGSTENNSLELAANKAYIEGGAIKFELASGKRYRNAAPAKPAEISVIRKGGGTGNAPDKCGFKVTNESCELEIKVTSTGKAAELEFVGDKFAPVKGENKFEMVVGAKNPECKKGKAIGAVGKFCFVKITYNGGNNPGAKKYVWVYVAEALEKGGTNGVGSGAGLEAEE